MNLPPWLQENNPPLDPSANSKLKSKPSFIEKTLEELISFMRQSVFSEQIALKQGLLQSMKPRVKLFGLGVLLLTINLIQHLSILWGLYLFLLILGQLSGISLRHLIKRVWLVIPLFTGVMLLPSLFNWVQPGDPVWTIWTLDFPVRIGSISLPSTLAITKQGLAGALLIISRVGISITLAFIVTLTTRWYSLLRALRQFFVPKIFITILEMTYRYIYVLITVVEDLFLARKARDAKASTQKQERRFVASSMAVLFSKSLHISEDIYASMLARGFTGDVQTLDFSRLRWSDAFALSVIFLGSVILYVADKALGG